MLAHLDIQHFGIIRHSSLDFSTGLTVLTGETGVGKSMLFDALGFVLGDRADVGLIHPDYERCEIVAEFEPTPEVQNWLKIQEITADNCLIRRILNSDGKSRSWINGIPCTLQQVRELAL